jgi:hypothetical protein
MAVIDTSQLDFTPNEQITSTKLNNILNQSVFVAGAVADGTLEVSGGQLRVKTIGTGNIGDSQITTGKIADANVTPAKFSLGRIDFNNWTTDGAKVSTTTLAYGRTTSQAGTTNLDFRASDATVNTTYDARISRASGAVGALSIDNVYDPADTTTDTRGQIDFKINGTAKLTIKQDGTILFGTTPLGAQTGTAPIYGARAWVNFNGTTSSDAAGTYFTGTSPSSSSTTLTVTSTAHGFIAGHRVCLDFTTGTATDGSYLVVTVPTADTFTVTLATAANTSGNVTIKKKTIRQKGNVHSVVPLTTTSTGDYYINFLVALPDADYAIAGFSNYSTSGVAGLVSGGSTISQTATTAQVSTSNSTSGNSADFSQISVTFFR